jgi:hypothetical protein
MSTFAMDQDQPNAENKIVNENNMMNPTASMLLDMKNYMIAQQAHQDKLQRQQMEQNARHESQMQLTNNLMNQMLEMNLNIRNESMLQNNSINIQLANLAVKGKSHPKNAVELFAAASSLIREAVTTNLPEATADLWDNAFAHFKIYGNYREAFEAEIVDPEVAKFASIAKLLNNGKTIQTTTTKARSVNVSAPTSAKKCNRCGRIGHMKADCYAATNVEGERF